MNRIYKAKKENGVFHWLEEDLMYQDIETFKDGWYQLIIRPRKKSRSDNQNRYLWGVVYKIIANETGHTEEEVHEHMKWQFLRKRGGRLETVKSTTNLTTIEFEEYTENIRRFAATKLNIQIPLPNEVDYEV